MGSSAVVHARSGGDDSEDGIGSVVGSSTGGGGGSTGGGVNEVDLLFDSKKVAMILAKMEGLKQSFPNAGSLAARFDFFCCFCLLIASGDEFEMC